MITQKGLKDEDIITIIDEDRRGVTFSVGFEDCEKFAVSKRYASAAEYQEKVDADYNEFKDNLDTTIFTVSADEDEKELAVNDSWGSIFNDAMSSVKTKLFQ